MVEPTTARNESRPDLKNPSDTMGTASRTSGFESQQRATSDKQPDNQPSQGSASNDDMSGSYDVLKKDFDKLREDMTALAKTFSENQQHVVKRFTSDLVKEGQHLLNSAKTKGETAVKSATDSSKQAANQFESRIKERPFISMLISFLTGLVVARLLVKH